jgi:23S rRNA pseudouridine1911/1915/1917 synthase
MSTTRHTVTVPPQAEPRRVDAFVADALPHLSRSRIVQLVHEGLVLINGAPCRAAKRVEGGEMVEVIEPILPPQGLAPVAMPLDILFEDDCLAVLNKPAGLTVHPGAATVEPTLVHGLLHCYPELRQQTAHDRPGIVHRLDRDTSGCIVVARSEAIRLHLLQQFAQRTVRKEYFALTQGVPRVPVQRIELPIGRSDHERKKMSVTSSSGRHALSEVRLLEEFQRRAAALAVRIMTGRTHQIRVHLAHIGLPVLGDGTYGRAARALSAAVGATRQMLHAQALTLRHPRTGEEMTFIAPLPDDMLAVSARLRTTVFDV